MTKPLKLDDLARALWAVSAEPENGDVWGLSEEWKENHRIHIRAVLTTIKEAGWAIVPVEAGPLTIAAGQSAYQHDYEYGLENEDMALCYAAMISAAPQIEGE